MTDILNVKKNHVDEIINNYVKGFSVTQISRMVKKSEDDIYDILVKEKATLKSRERYRYLKNGKRVSFSEEQKADIIKDFNHGVLVRNIAYNHAVSSRTIRDVVNGIR